MKIKNYLQISFLTICLNNITNYLSVNFLMITFGFNHIQTYLCDSIIKQWRNNLLPELHGHLNDILKILIDLLNSCLLLDKSHRYVNYQNHVHVVYNADEDMNRYHVIFY